MSAEAAAPGSLSDVYAHQVRADLERVEAEIARTEARLEALRADRLLLGRLWENLGAAEGAAVPRARGVRSRQAAPAPVAPESGPASRGPAARRGSVRDAVVRFLRACEQPVSVNDIFAGLPAAVRSSGKVVVRNAVEALVAKGDAERSREGQSVRYTWVAAADADA
ncbi:hypothetical protein [Streptomyces sp. NPDC094468]|uniref:hypothetical protein n=1 Tax=Streptomyces sp. NPDC094468 TaxID=3366066 RepID=UPI00382A58B6